MKKKFAIFNLILMGVVLITVAFQSIHAYSHSHLLYAHHEHSHEHETKEGEPKEFKTFGSNDHHHENEDCFICDFHFGYFIAPQELTCRLYFPFKPIPYVFNSIEGSISFSGSLFALRAPPALF